MATDGKALRTSSCLAQLGGILEDEMVFHLGQRHALIIDRRGELLHAGHLAASVAEAALTFGAAAGRRQYVAVDGVPLSMFCSRSSKPASASASNRRRVSASSLSFTAT